MASEKGSVEAMVVLGGMALKGNLPRSDPIQAVDWFRNAAEKGHAEAQTRLGMILYEGGGVKQNVKGGMEWMHKAASQHYPVAEGSLAIMYAEGLNGMPDYDKATKWARRGALQGDHLAQRTLGFLYLEGKGVEPSKLSKREDHKRLAFKWLTLAKKGGVKDLEPALKLLSEQLGAQEIRRAIEGTEKFRPEVRYNPNK